MFINNFVYICIMSIGIYKITSPSGKIYIGQSKNIENRFSKYRIGDCLSQKKLRNSFLKYGVLNHTFEILEVCFKEILNERECYYIAFFDTWNTKHGLNLRQGGVYGSHSQESIEANRKAHTGKKASQETKDKMRESRAKWTMPPETGRKISEAKKGIKFSKEHAQKLADVRKTSVAFAEAMKRKGLKQGKKVINTLTGQIYNSAKEAAAAEGYLKDSLTPQLNGHQKNRTDLKYL